MRRFSFLCTALLVLPTLAFTSASAAATGKLSAVINDKSFHIGAKYDWNESNYGMGFEYELPSFTRWKTVLMANGFLDSTESTSYMAGAGLHRRLVSSESYADFYFDIGLDAFLMTRNDHENGRPFPGVLPCLSIGNRHAGINLTYLPKAAVEGFTSARVADPSLTGVVFVQFKISLNAPKR